MKNLKLAYGITAFLLISFLSTSCLRIESRDPGEKANEKLEGSWRLDEFKINELVVTPGEGETTISFLPTSDVSKDGKMITSQHNAADQVADYLIDADGKTIIVDDVPSEFTVDERSLKLWQSSTELGEEVVLEMTLSKK